MALYRYVKKKNIRRLSAVNHSQSNPRLISLLLMIVGFFFLANAAYPIISYQLLVSPRFSNSFVSPSTEAAIAQSFGAAQDQSFVRQPADQDKNQAGSSLGSEIDLLDLTKASNWFPEGNTIFEKEEKEFTPYFLSIPKLGISNAVVIDRDDLKKSLVHYPGTVAPGRFGNTIIFGHSVLPQFFNPKNYLTIFSTLPTLRPRDEIFVNYNSVTYKYVVEQMIEVLPNDISILAQRYDDSYLTLITCVPPGTYLKRLIVRARLTKI